MAAVGLKWAGEIRDDTVWIFPKNWLAVTVFRNLDTQWHVVSGVAGLRYQGLVYASIEPVMNALGVPKKKRADTFRRLRVIEAAATEQLNAR